jgi:hypothetical protein
MRMEVQTGSQGALFALPKKPNISLLVVQGGNQEQRFSAFCFRWINSLAVDREGVRLEVERCSVQVIVIV